VLAQWRNFLNKLRQVNYLAMTGADYGNFPTALDKPFTERLYKHLSGHLSFIAHYNRRGFLSARFGTAADTAETIEEMRRSFVGSGYRDIHTAMLAELAGNAGQAVLNNG
jgi:hypothetical protein